VQLDNGANDFPYPNGVDTPTTRNPLTSVATTRNGDIILFTVEGRATFSVGMSYPEESAALLDLGAWNAVNLDGGGSTQLFTGGQYVTMSSDGYVTSSSGGTVSNGAERADGDALVWVP
jgi:exopolysaccharide biosynthesis protein